MIYTVTLNPAIDYIVRVPDFRQGETNRSSEEIMLPGGKGINVSIILSRLGVKNIALGFLAGDTGRMLDRLLKKEGAASDFVFLEQGMTRINIKLKAEQETEINGRGPDISKIEREQFYQKLELVQDGDILVLAGSVPGSLPESLYCDVIRYLSHKQVRFVVDTEGDSLKRTLAYRPFLIKPNQRELEMLFGYRIEGKNEAVRCAKILREKGAQNVLVSMGGEGAVMVTEDGLVYEKEAPKGELINSTGAGDSMVAGFLAGYQETQDYKHAFLKGMAAGSASAFSQDLASKKEIYELFKKL